MNEVKFDFKLCKNKVFGLGKSFNKIHLNILEWLKDSVTAVPNIVLCVISENETAIHQLWKPQKALK